MEKNKDKDIEKVEFYSTFSIITIDKTHNTEYNNNRADKIIYGDVAQLARATGSYPVGRRFEPHRRYQNIQ